jgi:transcription initiation factor TFIIIB Brf1 subunit/transcription initiation factor TFIIB
MLKQSDAYNDDYNPPLGINEVNGILKSIEKYVWMRRDYYKQRYERKIGLNAELPLKTKQSLGAAYTASIKVESTLAKIKAARLMIAKTGNKATQKAVSEVTGLSIRTIKTYWL